MMLSCIRPSSLVPHFSLGTNFPHGLILTLSLSTPPARSLLLPSVSNPPLNLYFSPRSLLPSISAPLDHYSSPRSLFSLTLSISGIGKEIVTLVLDSRINGTRLSRLNILGLCVCLNGIGLHVYHKWRSSSPAAILEDDLTIVEKGHVVERHKWIELSEIKSWERKKDLLLGGGGGGVDVGTDDSQSKLPLMSTRVSM